MTDPNTPLIAQIQGTETLINGERLWDYSCVDTAAPHGLGRFAYRDWNHNGRPLRTWYYRAPNRPWIQITWAKMEPPPLPRPTNEHQRCGCSDKEHICGACGQPFWLEYHGVADGECTYCYYRG